MNALHPGLVETDMTRTDPGFVGPDGESYASIPMGRHGQPRDIADAAVFLAGPLSSWVPGASLVVDGGVVAIG